MSKSFEFANSTDGGKSFTPFEQSLMEGSGTFSQMYRSVSEAEYSLLRPKSIMTNIENNNISMTPALGSELNTTLSANLSIPIEEAPSAVPNASASALVSTDSVSANVNNFDGNYIKFVSKSIAILYNIM